MNLNYFRTEVRLLRSAQVQRWELPPSHGHMRRFIPGGDWKDLGPFLITSDRRITLPSRTVYALFWPAKLGLGVGRF